MNPITRAMRSISSRLRPQRNHLVIACFPKSGSTYMANALCEITGFGQRNLCEWYNHNEQDVSVHKLRKRRVRSVIQQHFKGTFDNVRLLNEYGIRPVVNVRNIFDTIVSLHDHFDREDHKVCTGYVHREYWDLNFDERMHYLIRIHLPWFFNFFMSWREAADQIETLPMTYERFFGERVGALQEILRFYGIEVPAERIETAIERLDGNRTRLNQGRSGRGEEMLSDAHKTAILEMASTWCVDLDEMAPIGISAAMAGRVETGSRS